MMKLEKSQNLSQTVNDARVKLDRLLADRERAELAAATGDAHAQEIADLERQRDEAAGQAFIAGQPADVASLEKAIAAVSKKSAEALAQAAAARSALGLLALQIGNAEQALQDAQRDQFEAALVDIGMRYDEVESEYFAAVEQVLDRVAKLDGVARIRDALGRRLGVRSNFSDHVSFVVARNLGLPRRDRFGHWPHAGQYQFDHGAEQARQIAEQLSAMGIKANGPALTPPPAPIAPAERRPVSITRVAMPDEPGVVRVTLLDHAA